MMYSGEVSIIRRSFQFYIAVFMLTAVLIADLSFGDTFYVRQGASGDGSSWTNASGSLDDALEDTDSTPVADEIWVAEGTYNPTKEVGDTGLRYQAFQMKNEVAIYGGFAATGNPAWQDRDPNAYETILSGEIGGHVSTDDNSYHVFNHSEGTDLDRTAILDGCTITGGHTTGFGGGMYNSNDSPTVTNCTFSNNFARYGAAICNYPNCDPVITACIFTDNWALVNGGGIYNIDSNSLITDCTFINNRASDNGGGICNVGYMGICDPIITGCTFIGNSASQGGGICNVGYMGICDPIITGCVFSNNSTSEFGLGGGLYNGGNTTVTRCSFVGNSSGYKGGGIYTENKSLITDCRFIGNSSDDIGSIIYSYGELTVTNCTFAGNSAQIYGGMAISSANANITNCAFTGNSAQTCSAIFLTNSDLNITNCTFTGNSAQSASAIFLNSSNVNMTNCISWGNSSTQFDDIYNSGSTLTISYCNIQGGQSDIYNDNNLSITNWGIGNIDVDPMFVDPDNGDFHLKSQGWRWDIHKYRSCDFTGENIVNYADFKEFARSWQTAGQDILADIDKDEFVGLEDLRLFGHQYLTDGSKTGGWTRDDVTSRCIDAGNPGSPLADELLSIPGYPDNPYGENLRINMGAYGGTAEASMQPYGWALTGDINNDGTANLQDFAIQASLWSQTDEQLPADLDRNGTVGITDLAKLASDWLKETTWTQ